MLDNVLYDRKDMKYDELFNYVVDNKMLIICCIESHFTGFQILSKDSVIYYNPLSSGLEYIYN